MPKIWNDLDEAIIGTALVWDASGHRIERVVYNGEKIVSIFMKRDNMTYEEAVEYVEFNIEGAYIGEDTPIIVYKRDVNDIKENI